jgi:hypothetical protein
MKKLIFARLTCLFVLASAAVAAGQYEINWSTVDGGGAMASAGGGYELSGTIGQADAGSPAAPLLGGGYELVGGFWPVANVCFCPADMNGDFKKDGADVQRFVQCILSAGNCSCADVDQADGVTLADVAAFVNDLLAGSTCP